MGRFAQHRGPLPPAPPPPRPNTTLPPDYDAVNIHRFSDEFEAWPLPDRKEAKQAAPICDSTNMNYLHSALPISFTMPFDAYFQRMASHGWNRTRPSAQATARGFLRPAGMHRDVANPNAVDRSRPNVPGGVGGEWRSIASLQRINAYVFRGDQRPAHVVRSQGGFQPPSSRTDDHYKGVVAKRFVEYMQQRYQRTVDVNEVLTYINGTGQAGKHFVDYEIWRSILQANEMNIERMVADEFMKGFVSTSRSVESAKIYTSQGSDGTPVKSHETVVYALHSAWGFLLPPQAAHRHGSKGTEAEVAHPGPLGWDKVMAFRTFVTTNFNDDRTFNKSGVLFVRRGFLASDPKGCSEVVASLGSVVG